MKEAEDLINKLTKIRNHFILKIQYADSIIKEKGVLIRNAESEKIPEIENTIFVIREARENLNAKQSALYAIISDLRDINKRLDHYCIAAYDIPDNNPTERE